MKYSILFFSKEILCKIFLHVIPNPEKMLENYNEFSKKNFLFSMKIEETNKL